MVAGQTKDRGSEANARLELIRAKYERVRGVLDERARRWWVANEAIACGRGGVTLVHEATGLSRSSVRAGMREIAIAQEERAPVRRIRTLGAGRKPHTEKQPGLVPALKRLVDPGTRGDPMSPLLWTSKSVEHLASALQGEGYAVSADTVARLLTREAYSLQGNRKTLDGRSHPDRDAQFQFIAALSQGFIDAGQPVISVDTKKKEKLGQLKNGGREYQPKGQPEKVSTHDFGDPELGKGIPYGTYDLARNAGYVNVGIDHDTADFAVESIRRWWKLMGAHSYPAAQKLLVTADCGGSNGYRVRAWKFGLQTLADELNLIISICHFPPGTSKWNKIEHRLFSHITQNWRGRPLVSHEVIVNLIAGTTTKTGLTVRATLDTGRYPKGRKISKEQMETVRLDRAEFHGEWNYTITPRHPSPPV